VIDEGRILQTGPTPDVYHNPATLKVAEVFSDPPINYLDGRVNDRYAFLGRDIKIPLSGHLRRLAPGDYTFGIRSNHLFLFRLNAEDAEITAEVELSEINGSETFIHINHYDTFLVVQDVGIHPRKIGSRISVFMNPASLFVYDSSGTLIASPSPGSLAAGR